MKKIALITMVIGLLSQFIGFLREVLVANYYGASLISDSYIVAIISPTIIMGLIASGLTAVFIPKYSNVLSLMGEESSRKYTVNLIVYLFIIGVLITLVCFYSSNYVLKLFAFGFTSEALILAERFFEITIITMPFILMNTVLLGYLQIYNQYIYTSFIIIPSNLIGVLFVYTSYLYSNVYLLVLGYLISILMQFIFLVVRSKKHGLFSSIKLSAPDKNFNDTILLALPVILGVSLNQINFIIDRSMASTLGDGSISIVNYATRISSVVEAIIITTLVSMFYPKMSSAYSEGNEKKLFGLCNELLIVIMFFSIPLVCCFILYSSEIVDFLFGRGEFNENAITQTAKLLSIYAFSIPLIGIRTVLCKAFYSSGDTRTPVYISSVSVLINILLNLLFIDKFGLIGLAIASIISAFISVITLLYYGQKRRVFLLEYKFLMKLFVFLFFYFFTSVLTIKLLLPDGFIYILPIEISFIFESILIISLASLFFYIGSARWFSKSIVFIDDAILLEKFKVK